ncbi:hypothetical protein ACTXT7_009328 [Hymenolepis weldensis]
MKQKLERKLIEPTICNDDQPPPTSTNAVPCKVCPPGTKQINNTYCESCESGQFSTADGKDCQACPHDEVPIFGIKYSNWTRLPPRLSTYCIDDEPGCRIWQPNGSSIFVGPGLENYVYSSLELDLSDGFLSSGPNDHYYINRYAAPLPGTKLVFDFELDCVGFKYECKTFGVYFDHHIQNYDKPIRRYCRYEKSLGEIKHLPDTKTGYVLGGLRIQKTVTKKRIKQVETRSRSFRQLNNFCTSFEFVITAVWEQFLMSTRRQ